MKISFIISAYNRRELVLKCLNSIFAYATQPFEVIYIDEFSTDGTIEAVKMRFPLVKIVVCNLRGAAPTKNFGANYATGELIAFIDSDAEITENWSDVVRSSFLRDRRLGVMGFKVVSPYDRKLQEAGGLISPIFTYVNRVRLKIDINRPSYVYSVIGAAIVVRRKLFMELGKFDDDFLYTSEEPDFCWRVWMAGYKVLYVPIVVYHRGCTSKYGIGYAASQKDRMRTLFKLSVKNALVSFLKNGELATVTKFFVPQIFYYFIWVSKEKFPEAMLLGILEFLKDFKKSVNKRRIIQRRRRLSDKVIKKIVGTCYI
jgi:GT2 family glycosyltransferase